MRHSNYDKSPYTEIDGDIYIGWEDILNKLNADFSASPCWAIDLYSGTYEDEIINAFAATGRTIINTRSLMLPEEDIVRLTQRFITDDVLFGYLSNVRLNEYFDPEKVEQLNHVRTNGNLIIIGTGAALFAGDDAPVIYADMARWELQMRFRRHEVKALGVDNRKDGPSIQYKRGYFNDWRVCDLHKRAHEGGQDPLLD
jgi:hypothetical protein